MTRGEATSEHKENEVDQKLKRIKFLINSIPLKTVYIIDGDLSQVDGMLAQALI